MRKKVHKWIWAWDFDKEEKWLNEMSDKGWSMVSYSFCTYELEKTDAERYTYRLELLKNGLNHPESQSYLEFLEETGAEQVGSWGRWVYLRKNRKLGSFDLFSDYESKIAHLKRIVCLFVPLGFLNVGTGTSNILMGIENKTFISPANFWAGCLCLSVALLLLYGSFRIWRKIKRLEKEKAIYE